MTPVTVWDDECHVGDQGSGIGVAGDVTVVVTEYVDDAVGTMVEVKETGGHFTEVVLRPRVTLQAGSNAALAAQLHEKAHHLCFVANSVNFPVRVEPSFQPSPGA